ncbi:MAG: hypothetical protein IT364_10245 [Candidatus Hydrogenedentes bacterium]|nr:hypothetical protein [Candidatus Hydrogenedentota bacterium]
MKRFAVLAVLCLVALVACKKDPPQPPTPPPPPPPTAEALEQRVMEKVEPLMADPLNGKAMTETLSKEVASLKTELNGASAQARLKNQFIDKLKEAHQAELWDSVVNLCDAVDILDPGNTRTSRYRQRAMDEKSRPVVTMTGVFELDGVTTVFLEIYLPLENRTIDKQVREGEEFEGLILEKIIGNNQGVRLKYLKTDTSFDVMKK